jgi:predicted MFS family arabinose efflux permease
VARTTRRKLAFLGSLYITQFLALGFFYTAFPAIMRAEGVDLAAIGAFYLLGLVWVVKFAWAPLVDRVGFGRLGHHRGWLLLCQSVMVALLLVLAAFAPPAELQPAVLLMLVIAVFAATQDIAVDALAVRLLTPQERGGGNAVQSAGGFVGNLIGGGAVLAAYAWFGWAGSMVVLAAGTALPLTMVLRNAEPPGSPSAEEVRPGLRDIVRLFQRPGMGGWLATASLFFLGIGLAYALLTPLLVDAGWSLGRIAFAVNVVGSVAGVAGAWLGGWLIDRSGRRRALLTTALASAASVALLLLPAAGMTSTGVIWTAVTIAMAAYGATSTAVNCTVMDRCEEATAGTDFTVQYSVLSAGSFVIGSVGLAIASAAGYGAALTVAIALSLLAAGAVARRDDLDVVPQPAAA